MYKKKKNKVHTVKIMLLMLMLLICFQIPVQKAEADENTRWLKEDLDETPEIKKTDDGFYYTMSREKVMRLLQKCYKTTGNRYKKIEKQFSGKKKCCFIISYLGKKKKNIRLPEQIEGVNNYVLCICDLSGLNKQVKSVTIPANVKVSGILHGNPCDEGRDKYYDYPSYSYKFIVEKGNTSLSSKDGVLYSKDKKIMHGIPTSITGKFVVPDSVEKMHLPLSLYISELVLGKNVSRIYYHLIDRFYFKKIRVKKGNKYFKAVDDVLYSRDMKKIYFSVSRKKGTYKMPDTVEKMDEWAFVNNRYKKIITSDKLKSLPYLSVYNDYLEELYIGKNVSKISKTAFNGYIIKKITVHPENKYFVMDEGHLYNIDKTKCYK